MGHSITASRLGAVRRTSIGIVADAFTPFECGHELMNLNVCAMAKKASSKSRKCFGRDHKRIIQYVSNNGSELSANCASRVLHGLCLEVCMLPTAETPSLLSDFVNRYQICWEVWPEYVMVGSKERQVGLELELTGTPEPGTDHVGPGCPACRRVYSALHAIADWVLPKEERPSRYEIGPYEQAVRYSAARGSRPDVTLSVKVLHRRGFDQPVDQCEIR